MSDATESGAQQLRRLRRFAIGALLVATVVAGWGIFTRLQARAALRDAADAAAVPIVSIIHAQRSGDTDALTLPSNVQDDQIKARHVNGVLEVTIPKTPTPEPRHISVETH